MELGDHEIKAEMHRSSRGGQRKIETWERLLIKASAVGPEHCQYLGGIENEPEIFDGGLKELTLFGSDPDTIHMDSLQDGDDLAAQLLWGSTDDHYAIQICSRTCDIGNEFLSDLLGNGRCGLYTENQPGIPDQTAMYIDRDQLTGFGS